MKLIVTFTDYPSAPAIINWDMQLRATGRPSDPDAIGERLHKGEDATNLTERIARLDWLSRRLAPIIEDLLSEMPADFHDVTASLESLPLPGCQ